MTKTWPIHEAKARFTKLLEASVSEGPQIITKRGVPAAVMLSIAEWQRLNTARLKYLLLDDPRRFDLDIPDRKTVLRKTRPPIEFD